ncbi:MAG: class I SAM-dependent methyltransferase [Chloroflexota bacterium]|nr:MAG: class I SAM-dependent methyltransferase [Chloroflexota bacterium]
MTQESLFKHGRYTLGWIKDFYEQAGIWWGDDPQAEGVDEERARCVDRLCGPGPLRVLDLGAGTGTNAAAIASHGHSVVAVELSTSRANFAKELAKQPHKGSLTVIEGDFYTVELDGRFDVVCLWETFGLGADADQRRLLARIVEHWLAPGGSILMDVYHPAGPVRDAGKEWRLSPLKGVPGSVEMFERCHYDAVQGRWIDEWQPVATPEKALAQSVRCYTPADLCLLLEGAGLALKRVEIDGSAVDFTSNLINIATSFLKTYAYVVQLQAI